MSPPAARAATFNCLTTGGDWATAASWTNCNGEFPNNGGGNTFNAEVTSSTSTLNAAVTVGNVTVDSGEWSVVGASASANLTGSLSNTGAVSVDGGLDAGGGGGSLSLGGSLTNNAGATLAIGNGGLTASSTVAATSLSNSGTVSLDGNGAAHGALTLAGGLTNSGTVNVDNSFGGEVGGSIATLGGALNNDSGTLNIGNAGLGASTKVTAAGLSNTGGTIEITGNTTPGTTDQASLAVAASAPATSPGNISLAGDALLQFTGTSSIQAIGAGTTLALDGAQARVALSSSPASNSALTGLSSNAGALTLLNGASVTTIGVGLSNTGVVSVDGGLDAGGGGGSLSLGGSLTNNAGATLAIGNGGLTASSTVAATSLSNSGTVSLDGNGAAHGALTLAGGLTNSGTVNVDNSFGGEVGGSIATLGGALNNDSGTLNIGNAGLGASTKVTAAGLSNTGGTIEITGNTTPGTTDQASLAVAASAPATSPGNISLAGDALLQFTGTSSIQAIGAGTTLALDGAQARVALSSSPASNSALTGLSSNAGALTLLNGASVTTIGVGLSNTGVVSVDGGLDAGGGGGSLSLGGSLTNNAGATLAIGNGGLTASSTVAATSLSNSGTVSLDGNGAAHGALTLAGGLTNSGTVNVDNSFGGEVGGSIATLGGALNNDSGTLNIGNAGLGASTKVTAAGLSNTGGTIEITGNTTPGTTDQASLAVAASAPATSPGNISLAGDALLQFTGTSSIQAIGAGTTLALDGAQARVALSSSPASNSALTGLSSNTGALTLLNGASVTTIGVGLSNTGVVSVDGGLDAGGGGGSLSLGGSLTNNAGATLAIGNGGLTASSTVAATSLSNSGTVSLDGNGAAHGALTLAGGLTNSGTVNVDNSFGGEVGGSIATLGGALNNDSGTLNIGNAGLGASTKVTAAGLSNTGGTIEITGNTTPGTTDQASLAVAASAPATSPGNISLAGDALLQFTGTSSIQAIGAGTTLALDGAQARVALSSSPASNSALTGLSSNTGALTLLNGASVTTIGVGLSNTGAVSVDGGLDAGGGGGSLSLGGSLTNNAGATLAIGNGGLTASSTVAATSLSNSGTVSLDGNGAAHGALTLAGGLTNSGTVNVDNSFGGEVGGSIATLGGALNNDSGTLNIGNAGLGASTKVTAAGLSNTGTINTVGSSTDAASLTIAGAAGNSGTVNIGAFSNLAATGAGNAYAQTGGTTSVFANGTLAAPAVNVTGGTLQGNGTVAGAVNVSGAGTVEAVDPGIGAPATLTVNGSYNQTGGTLAALLQGTSPSQIGTLAVQSGNAVNLNGGNLAHAAGSIAYAAGQSFADVATFQPGQLFGTFGQLEGAGNGTSVNLGGGLTLEAFYNNAAGNISLQVVDTPATTALIWKDATGSWDTAGDWTTGTVPTPVADVTIGNTTTGNVTLGHDATINSLQINASNALTTTGGTLTVGANVTDNGSLTLGGGLNLLGTLTAGNGASVSLNNGGAITDATLAGAGTFQTNAGQSGTLHGVTISNGTTYVGQSGSTTTMNGTIVNNGTLEAAGGAIDATTGFNGTGTAKIDAGGTMTIGADSTVGTLAQNGTLALGTHNITVATDYTNANFGSGNSFNAHAGVTGTGKIDAAGPTPDNMQVITGADVSNGGTATPTLALGNVHVGDSTTYDIASQGTAANPSLRGAIQTNNGGNITELTGTGVTPANFGPIAPGTGSTLLTVTASTAGALSGQAVHIANNFDNVRAQTMSITGNAYAFASPTWASSLNPKFDFGVVQVGQTYTDPLTVTNTLVAANAAFQEGLNASFGSPSTSFLSASGSITNLAAGAADSSSMVVSLHPTSTGTVSGTVPINFASNGAGTSGLGITTLAGQNLPYNWTFSGTVVNPANPSITPTSIDFGNVRIGSTQQQALSVTNIAGTPPQASLDAQISAVGPATSNNGTINQLLAGSTDTTSLTAGLDTSVAGARSGTATVALQSDSAPNGCTSNCIVDLPSQGVTVKGNVFRLATGSAASPANLGNVRIGTALTGNLSITNTAANDGFSENLDAAITATTPDVTGSSGSVTGLAAGQTNSTGINVTLDSSSAGAKSGTATVQFQSDGTGIDGGAPVDHGSQTVTATGKVFRLATGSASTPVDLGAARIGIGTLSGNLSITNTAANDGFSEDLDAAVSGFSPDVVGASGSVTGLAAGQTNSTGINVRLDNSSAGLKSGTATVQFQSDGTGIDGGAPIDNGSQAVTVTGKVYTPAVAKVVTTSPVDFGIVHVGDGSGSLAQSVTVQNGAAASALNDVLVGTIGAGGTPFSGSGNLGAGLAAGASSSALQVALDTHTAGIFTSAANLALASHDPDLADLALTTSPLALNAQVNNFAKLAFQKSGGDGTLGGGGASFDSRFRQCGPGQRDKGSLARLPQRQPARRAGLHRFAVVKGDDPVGLGLRHRRRFGQRPRRRPDPRRLRRRARHRRARQL